MSEYVQTRSVNMDSCPERCVCCGLPAAAGGNSITSVFHPQLLMFDYDGEPQSGIAYDGFSLSTYNYDSVSAFVTDKGDAELPTREKKRGRESLLERLAGETRGSSKRANLRLQDLKFDFTWFTPAIVKYRTFLGEVLVARLRRKGVGSLYLKRLASTNSWIIA